jgi:hypothetical protein
MRPCRARRARVSLRSSPLVPRFIGIDGTSEIAVRGSGVRTVRNFDGVRPVRGGEIPVDSMEPSY